MPDLKTQISSKYSPDNSGLFPFKALVCEAGLRVSYPVGDQIIEYECGFAVTIPHERETPFALTEIDFLHEVLASDVQIAYDVYGDLDGYLGESTAIETALALLRGVPAVFVRPVSSYSEALHDSIRAIFERHAHDLTVIPLDKMSPAQVRSALKKVVLAGPTVRLNSEEASSVVVAASMLTHKYWQSWTEYKEGQGA